MKHLPHTYGLVLQHLEDHLLSICPCNWGLKPVMRATTHLGDLAKRVHTDTTLSRCDDPANSQRDGIGMATG